MPSYSFGDFILDTDARVVSRAGEPVSLAPKEFHALQLLVQAAGRAVEREAMMQAIWPDTAVGDTSLGKIISVLRRHFGAEAIVSIPKFGYRLVPVVSVVRQQLPEPLMALTNDTPGKAGDGPVTPAPQIVAAGPSRRAGLRTWAIAAVAALAVAGIVYILSNAHIVGASRSSKSDVAATRWDQAGVFALREGTYFKASKAFGQAISIAPHYAMAHAHLAEAWLQLKRQGAARDEILLATDRESMRHLSEQDQHYIEAIRATVVRDFPTATSEFESILKDLPQSERANGLADLAGAYQREGRITQAVETYKSAADLDPSNAGVQLKLGILMGLQRDQASADAYFDRATALYNASSNLEGVAEVNHQRGSMAYVRADYGKAELYYGNALEIANKLADPTLQARALGSLSTVERWEGKFAESQQHAEQAIQVSRNAGSDYDYAEGVMLLANLAVARGDVPQSKALLKQALDLAEKVRDPRLVANAEFTNADFSDQLGDYDDEIAYARRAKEDYESYGSVDGGADAWMLIVQGEAGKGDLQAALQEANALLDSSVRTHSDVFAEDTEAEIGHIYTAMEDDPDALPHFQRALEYSRKTGSQEALKSLHIAACLARMGRAREAADLFSKVPRSAAGDPDSADEYQLARIAIDDAEGRYGEIVRLGRSLHMKDAQAAYRLKVAVAEAELRLGQNLQAGHDAGALLAEAEQSHNPFMLYRAQLLEAQVAAAAHDAERTHAMAEAAGNYCRQNGLKKSELLALFYDTLALRAMGKSAEGAAQSARARQVLEEIRKQWPEADYKAWTAIPGIRQEVAKLNPALIPGKM